MYHNFQICILLKGKAYLIIKCISILTLRIEIKNLLCILNLRTQQEKMNKTKLHRLHNWMRTPLVALKFTFHINNWSYNIKIIFHANFSVSSIYLIVDMFCAGELLLNTSTLSWLTPQLPTQNLLRYQSSIVNLHVPC